MTEHLPECWSKHPSDPEAWCICDELRACAKRVTAHERSWENAVIIARAGYQDGYAKALDEAREAVVALPEYSLRDTALAAIDAL